MKTFTTILLLAAFSLVKSTSPAADVVQKAPSSLELVLIDDHVVFTTATNISMEMEMEAWLIGLPRGSVVHYDANGFLPRVVPAKLEPLEASCQKKGVSFIESPVN